METSAAPGYAIVITKGFSIPSPEALFDWFLKLDGILLL
jgi:hypothetical protein